ncbi:PAS domain S-box protein [Geovibrio thiophilus]|nr:PAS domain S-box protein [Geovibrio thiophilus]
MKFETDPAYFLDSIYNGACILDDELTVLFWNKWLEAHTSLFREQVTGKKITDLFPEINVKQLKRKIRSMKALRSHTYYDAGTDGWLFKIKSAKFTNSLFEYMKQNVVISPFDKDLNYALVMIYDQTRLFETQKKLEESESFQRAVFGRSASGIVILNTDKSILTTNESFRKMAGSDEDELKGMDFERFLSPDHTELCRECFGKLYSGQADSVTEDVKIQMPGGRKFWSRIAVSVIFDQEGKPEYIVCVMDDITERRNFLDELEKKSEYVQKILDFQSNIIIVTDGEFLLNCNKSFLDFFQAKSLDEFKSKKKELSDYFMKEQGLITGEDEQGWLEEVFQNFRMGVDSKLKMRDPFGAVRTFQVTFRVLPMTAGEYIVSLSDITDLENYHKILRDANRILEIIVNERTEELRKTNRMLESSRQQLEQAQQIARIGSWEWSGADRKLSCSDELYRIFGVDKTEVILSDKHFFEMVAQEDVQLLRTMVSEDTIARGSFDEYIHINRIDGERRILRVQSRIRTDAAGYINILGTAHDITEIKRTETALRQNEQLLSFIFDFASFGICLVDQEGSFIRFNRKFSQLLSIPEAALKQQNFFGLFPEADREKAHHTTEWKHELENGKTLDLLVTAGAVKMLEEEDKLHFIYSIADITEKNRIEKIHREQEQMLIQQSKLAALGEMIGAIAHQWKQPLNSASLYVQLIEDDYDFNELTKEKLSEYVIEIMNQLNFMAHTVEDFRTFFTPSKSLGEFSVRRALDDVVALMKSSLEKHKIKVSVVTEGNEPDSIVLFGYASEFKQVMVNLLSNARDAIDAKRLSMPPLERKTVGNIDVIITETDTEVIVETKDDGGGIPEDALKRIFESYFTTKGDEGTGIGLYMSRMIIENRMKGTIAASNSGKGAVFTMRFPREFL